MSDKMSKDRVKFFLDSRYFRRQPTQNGMTAKVCARILYDAFGEPGCAGWTELFRSLPDGFTIICRPSQFARFIVFRHERGHCINGIKDLRPELVDAAKPKRVYDTIAERFPDLCPRDVHDVLAAADVPNSCVSDAETFDVSCNRHRRNTCRDEDC